MSTPYCVRVQGTMPLIESVWNMWCSHLTVWNVKRQSLALPPKAAHPQSALVRYWIGSLQGREDSDSRRSQGLVGSCSREFDGWTNLGSRPIAHSQAAPLQERERRRRLCAKHKGNENRRTE